MTLHTDCIVTYRKNNGDIIVRPRFYAFDLHIGDTTSMGWTVIDIHYQYSDGNYYHENDIIQIMKKNKQTAKQKIANYIIKKANKYR